MNISITFRQLPSSDALRDHAMEKVEKFKKYLIEPVDIHIVLQVEKIRQIAEITLKAKSFHTHAIEESPDMYSSIDMVVNKLETALRRHKERVKSHKTENKVYQAIG